MVDRTAVETVQQAVSDFDDIRDAIRGHKIEVPYPTPTRAYASLIAGITVGCINGLVKNDIYGHISNVIYGCCIGEMYGTITETLCGVMEVIAENEDED